MAQNTSGIDLCRELNLGVLSSGAALQNINLRRNLIQQGISYVFDQEVTLLIGDTPLRVLSVDNYTCLEESNLVIAGKIHGGSLNPINYHNREIIIPNGENITIYYDFNGLEVSSLPLIVPSDFNCTNCSVLNISNYSTSGDTQGIFVTVKPNTINTTQATLTLVSNLLSTSGVKIYFKPSIINYSNQAVYLSHDDINPLTQEQVVRVSSKFLTTDVTVQDIRNNLSMNNCTFLNHHFVNNDVFLTFIPQDISRESSIQLNKGFFKNSLNELSFSSNMLFFNWDAAYTGSIGSVSIPEIEQKDGKIFFNNISRETASNTELEFSSIETKILEGNNVITIINGNEPIDLCNLILPNNTNPGMHQLTIERKLIDSLGSSSSFMNIYINVTTNPLRVSQVDNFTCSIPQKVSASVSFGDGIFKDSYHKSSLETIFNLPLGLEGIVYYDFNGKSVNNITSNHFSCSGCDIVSMNPSLNSSNEIEGVFVKVKQLGLLPINGTLEGVSSLNLKSIDQNTIILPPQKIHWSDRGVKISLMNSLYPIVDYANILVTSSMPILNINDLTKIINNNAAIDSIIPNGLNEYIIKVVPNRSNEESYIQIEDAYMGNIIGSYSSNQITLQWGDPYTTQNTILPKGYLFIRNNNQEALLDYTVVGGETSNGPAIIPNISSTTTLEIGPSIIYSNTSNDQYLDLCLTNVNTSSRGIQNIIAKKSFMDSSNQINQLTYNFTAFISDGPDASFSGIITQVGAFNCPKIIKKSPVITSFTRGTSGVNLSVLSFVEVRGAFNGQTCSLWGNRTIDLINGVNSILPAPYNQSFANATTTYSICKLATTLAIGTYSTISAVRTINDCGGSISATIPNITIKVGNVAGVNRITNVNTFVCP